MTIETRTPETDRTHSHFTKLNHFDLRQSVQALFPAVVLTALQAQNQIFQQVARQLGSQLLRGMGKSRLQVAQALAPKAPFSASTQTRSASTVKQHPQSTRLDTDSLLTPRNEALASKQGFTIVRGEEEFSEMETWSAALKQGGSVQISPDCKLHNLYLLDPEMSKSNVRVWLATVYDATFDGTLAARITVPITEVVLPDTRVDHTLHSKVGQIKSAVATHQALVPTLFAGGKKTPVIACPSNTNLSLMASSPHFIHGPLQAELAVNTGELQHPKAAGPQRTQATGSSHEPEPAAFNSQAYVHVAGANQCMVQAINSFFQKEAITPADAAQFEVQHARKTCETLFGGSASSMRGLYHPSILEAVSQGRKCTIRKSDFMPKRGENYPQVLEEPMHQQWAALVRCGWSTQGRNPTVSFTPGEWLSALKGGDIHAVVAGVKQLQLDEHNRQHGEGTASKVQVHRVERFRDDPVRNLQSFKALADQLEAKRKQAPNQVFRAILYIQGRSTGHYFTIQSTPTGAWLNLDARGQNRSGLTECPQFAQTGKLLEELQHSNINYAIFEPLAS